MTPVRGDRTPEGMESGGASSARSPHAQTRGIDAISRGLEEVCPLQELLRQIQGFVIPSISIVLTQKQCSAGVMADTRPFSCH